MAPNDLSSRCVSLKLKKLLLGIYHSLFTCVGPIVTINFSFGASAGLCRFYNLCAFKKRFVWREVL
uniref:Uncharacterized protein n=1 Tax=Glossina palpalis gambiensis TaxID=67801 RepID=A0A1B0B033_9MUSC